MALSNLEIWNKVFTEGGPSTIKLECADGVVFGPELFLVNKSEYFAKMINSCMIEAQNKTVKVEKKANVVKGLLGVICTEKVDPYCGAKYTFELMDLARMWLLKDIVEMHANMIIKCWYDTDDWLIQSFNHAIEYKFDSLADILCKKVANIIISRPSKKDKNVRVALLDLSRESLNYLILFMYEANMKNGFKHAEFD